jgi:hypothetical protein
MTIAEKKHKKRRPHGLDPVVLALRTNKYEIVKIVLQTNNYDLVT